MQIKKTAIIAAVSAAALGSAVLGAPASAAPVDAATQATMLDLLARQANGGGDQALVVAATGSAVHAAPWQVCSSAAVAGVGGVVDLEPDVILGNCSNANVKLWQDTATPVVGALNDSAVLAAPWQVCGSDTVAGVGGTVSVQASKTVSGECNNANVSINVPGENGYGENAKATVTTRARAGVVKDRAKAPVFGTRHADTDKAQGLVSAGSGSAIIAAPWQVCGSAAVAGVGGVIPVQSPHTMLGDCNNANAHIRQDDPTAVVSALDNSHITAAAWQVCGSDSVAGVGGVISVGSPNIAYGDCNNANTIID